ncbi:unnamed protein product [Closterium sp. NIES-65]|nr:unnamed protein product [Closterium sp. NIES-65]
MSRCFALQKPYSRVPLNPLTPARAAKSRLVPRALEGAVIAEEGESLNGGVVAFDAEEAAGNGAVAMAEDEEVWEREPEGRGVSRQIVGVLGGGQLGRMLCEAASPLGIKVAVLDPLPDAPARPVAFRHVVGSFQDMDTVREFAKKCSQTRWICAWFSVLVINRSDVVTVEIEHVNVDALQHLEDDDCIDIEPKPSTIGVIQDKYLQKVHFRNRGVPLPDFVSVSCSLPTPCSLPSLCSACPLFGIFSPSCLLSPPSPRPLHLLCAPDIIARVHMAAAEAAGEEFSYPFMLKSRKNAYDGRGNAVVNSQEDIEQAVADLGGFERGLYAEKWAPFIKELAVMVARGRDGEIKSFPVVETTHRDNICNTVVVPAGVPPAVQQQALRVAELAIGSLAGAGVFGVELFLLADNSVLLNEVAPRPHNSGHYSIEACHVSQYEQHLRAVLGLPLGDPSLKVGAAAMVNILGEADGDEGFEISQAILKHALLVPGASIHWYDKSDMRAKRKMGHVTVVAPTVQEAVRRINAIVPQAMGDGQAGDGQAPQVAIIMGSDSDLPVMKGAAQILDFFQVPFELTIVSAHRTPDRMFSFAQSAHTRGIRVIIAGAGGAAHLPGMVASMSPLPVIGVPVKGSALGGMDSLLSIVQMPRGIPVATVAINNAVNAALLAVRMLGASDPALLDRMVAYQKDLEGMVLEKAGQLETDGWEQYLNVLSSD